MTNSTLYRLVRSSVNTDKPIEEWEFELDEVQQILQHLERYLGRSTRTVWEHSCSVAIRTRNLLAKRGSEVISAGVERAKWHDGSEAFSGDVPGPIKRCLGQGFRNFEQRIQDVIYAKAGVSTASLVERFGSDVFMQINAAVAQADQEDYEWEQTQMEVSNVG